MFIETSKWIQQYYQNPIETVEQLKKGEIKVSPLLRLYLEETLFYTRHSDLLQKTAQKEKEPIKQTPILERPEKHSQNDKEIEMTSSKKKLPSGHKTTHSETLLGFEKNPVPLLQPVSETMIELKQRFGHDVIYKETEELYLMENIWLQLDPLPYRLLFHSQPITLEQVKECLVSQTKGLLQFTTTSINWTMFQLEQECQASASSIKISYQMIQYYQIRPVFVEKKDRKLSMVQMTPQLKHKSTITTPPAFSLTLFLKGQSDMELNHNVLSFYPLYSQDVKNILQIMIQKKKEKPKPDLYRIQQILAYQLDLTRQTILLQLLQQSAPWIDHYLDLKQVFRNLCSSQSPSLYEMERVFHSCRREPEVMKETVQLIKSNWYRTHSQTIHLHLLTLMDRLISFHTLPPAHSSFQTLYLFLTKLEETMNGYKYPTTVRFIEVLAERMRGMKGLGVGPVHPGIQWDGQRQFYQQEQHRHQYLPNMIFSSGKEMLWHWNKTEGGVADMMNEFKIYEEEYFLFHTRDLWK